MMGGETGVTETDERGRFAPAADLRAPEALARNTPVAFQPTWEKRKRREGFGRIAARALAATRRALTLEQERGTTFLFVPVFLSAGAATYFLLSWEPPAFSLASGMALLALLAFLARTRPAAQLSFLAALVFVAGLSAGKIETWRAGTQMLGSSISTRLTGRVVAIENRADGRARLTLDVVSTERPHLRHAPQRVRATAGELPQGLRAGDGIVGVVRLMPATGPLRPQSYDFSFESYFDRIGANGFFLAGPSPAGIAAPQGVFAAVSAWIENARTTLAARIRATVPGPEGEIASALITGARSGIPEEASEALRMAGLAHILAISGLHMALVALTVMGTIRLGFALFPDFASRYPVKKYAAAVALVAAAFYLLVSGAAVAAQRAFIMIAIMLAALLFDRAALTMRNLAIAAIVVVAASPHEVVGPSFQMSFAATAALIAAYAWSATRGRKRARAVRPDAGPVGKALRSGLYFFGGVALTSLIAGLATGLFAAWHFQRAAPLGLLANLAAMPIVTLVVMPAAVASVVALPFGLDGFFLPVMGWGISLVLDVARFLSARLPFDDVGLIPASAVVLFSLALVFATLTTTWLRVTAIPLAIAGALSLGMREFPDALVSEDGRQMAVLLGDGSMAVNRSRPNGFTIEDWKRALLAEEVIRPRKVKPGAGDGSAPPASPDGFSCLGDLCMAMGATGGVFAHAANAEAARPACALATVIVIDDATAGNPCDPPVSSEGSRGTPSENPLVVTKRQLALQGSAAIYLDLPDEAGKVHPRIVQAISQPLRPWHDQRRYSREARGLAPYKPNNGPDSGKNE